MGPRGLSGEECIMVLRRVRIAGGTLGSAVLVAGLLLAPATTATGAGKSDTPTLQPGAGPPTVGEEDEEDEEFLLQRDQFFMSRRTAGDKVLDNQRAGALRAAAAQAGAQIRKQGTRSTGRATFDGAWTGLGPDPIVQRTRSPKPILTAMAGRIGALAIRPSNGRFILGGAQGGIWLYDQASRTWSPKTDKLPSLAIGAIAVAPSDDTIVYAGTGEGALSG